MECNNIVYLNVQNNTISYVQTNKEGGLLLIEAHSTISQFNFSNNVISSISAKSGGTVMYIQVASNISVTMSNNTISCI